MEVESDVVFEDHFPSIMTQLGEEGFIEELCNGFIMLMDVEKGVITYESLKTRSIQLGLHDIGDDEILCMLNEGDLDGDGALNQMEFCVLMFRLSPLLMDTWSNEWMQEIDRMDQQLYYDARSSLSG